MKSVAVVILNYKVSDLVVKCLQSLQKSTVTPKIIVVDNNSQDGIDEKVKKFQNIEFIQSGSNLGYSGGNNLGIKKAIAEKFDYILILNPDTIVEKDTIKILMSALDQDQVGIVGPKIYFEDGKTIWYAGGSFDQANVLGKHIGVDEKENGQYNKNVETDFITGAAMMVKKEVFQQIGFFDERYFLYYEDSDFCFRAKMKGFMIMYIADAIVHHANAKSTGLGSPIQDYFITRNRMLFASKFLNIRTRFALFREALRNLGNPVRRLALYDFLLGNFGKGSFIND